MTLKRIGVLYHPMISAAERLARTLDDFLTSQGTSVWLSSSWELEKARFQLPGTDLILSIGGDGTILRSAQVAIGSETPITGINLGKVGFMTELSPDEAMVKLPGIIAGDGWIDERAMLEVKLPAYGSGDERVFHALNDAVVARGADIRVLDIEAVIDGVGFTRYTADGVIAATATGSTGYSLAAGGPILHPGAREFLLLPMLPHLCLAYTLALPEKSVLKLRVSTPHTATLSIDGHTNLPIISGTTVTIKESPYRTRFLRIHPANSFYGTLEQKLRRRKDGYPSSESRNQ